MTVDAVDERCRAAAYHAGWTRASKFGGFGFLVQAKGPAYPIGYDVGGDHPVQGTGNYLGLN